MQTSERCRHTNTHASSCSDPEVSDIFGMRADSGEPGTQDSLSMKPRYIRRPPIGYVDGMIYEEATHGTTNTRELAPASQGTCWQ